MEDSGYMSRAAFIVDKLMHKIGLHGKSFIPMVMGFGCNVPAIMATRAIESRKSRMITIAIIPFMGIYMLGIVLAIFSAILLSKFVKDDDLPFVMELPPYRVPTGKAIWRHTWEKGQQYLQKMATTILVCSIIIWFLGYFPKSKELSVAQEAYAAAVSDKVNAEATPEVSLLAGQIDSLYAAQQGLLTGIAAKELVVSTLGVMYADGAKVSEGQDLSEDTQLQSALLKDISPAAALSYMVFILLYFPCIATFVAIKNETGKWRWAIACCVYTMIVAWLMAFFAYHLAMLF